MRRVRLLLATLTVVIVAIAVAALVVPQMLDWNRYRGAIAAVASGRLGRPVTIAGPVGLTLWPAPQLTAEQIDVGGEGHSGFHVAALRLRVGLWPLLAGHVEARELVLHGLDLRLPWPLPQAVLASRPPHWLGAFAARIEGGTLHLGNLMVTGVDATVTQADDGLLAAAGTAHFGSATERFTMRLAAPDRAGTAGLSVSFDGGDQLSGTQASFTGTVAGDGSLAGHVMARCNDLALIIGAPSLPFHLEGRLTVGDGLAAIDEATFGLGGAPASGALALRWTPLMRLDIAMSATRLDLDPWIAALLPVPGRSTIRTDLPVGLDLAVEAARLGGGTLQHLRARADMAGGSVHLREVSAILPGDAKLGFDGAIDTAAGATPRLTGALRLDAPALRTTLRWLNMSGMATLPLPPGPVLRTARFAANLKAERNSFELDGLAGRVDGAAVSGSLRIDGPPRPRFALSIAAEDLALDPWLSGVDLQRAATDPAAWLEHGGPAALVGGETARIAVHAEHASLGGVPITGLILDANIAPEDGLALRGLGGTVDGTTVSASGRITNSGTLSDARFKLSGSNGQLLASLAPAGVATLLLWKQPVALTIAGGGPPSALALNVALDLGDARLEAQPVINLNAGTWRASGWLRHPEAARLLGMLGLAPPPDMTGRSGWLGEGSLSLMGEFSGAAGGAPWGRLTADRFELTAGDLRASGELRLDGRQVTGTVDADSLPLPLPDPSSEAPLPTSSLQGWKGDVRVRAAQVVAGPVVVLTHAALEVSLADGMLTADGLSGQIDDGELSASASLNLAATPPALTAAVTLHDVAIHGPDDEIAVGPLSGTLDGAANLTASGYSEAALLATLGGKIHLSARDGAFAGFDLFEAARAIGSADAHAADETEQSLRAALQRGTTSFDALDMTGEAAHGLLHLTAAHLQGPAGTAQAQGTIGLTDGTVDVRVTLAPSVKSAPVVGLRLDGFLNAPIRQPELAAASRWLAERQASH